MNGPKKAFSRITFYGILFVAIYVLPRLIRFYTDWLWFQEVRFEEVFLTILKAKILVGILAGILVFGVLYINIILFRYLTKKAPIMLSVNRGGRIELLDITGIVNRFAVPVFILIGALSGLFMASIWQTVLQYFNQVPFGITDPIFGYDLAFYIFSLPMVEIILGLGSFVFFISFSVTLLLYIMKGSLIFRNRGMLETGTFGRNLSPHLPKIPSGSAAGRWGDLFEISTEAKIHLSILIAAWFTLTSIKIYFVQIPNLLYSTTGPFFGASYTDIHATLPYLYVLLAVSILGIFVSFLNIRTNGTKLIFGAFFLYVGTTVIGGWIYPGILQSFVVKPNELIKETPYIEHHIAATQAAWGLERVEKRNLTGDAMLTAKDIQENEEIIRNIRLWDRGPLLDTFGQIQEIRTYYDFSSVDNDRYTLDGEYRQVLLSPRELDSRSLPQRNFINERLTFTHGMGVALSPVNEKTEEGLPVLFIQDLPPQSVFPEIEITRPEIYYAEQEGNYVVVNTKAKEFDYPSGEENVYSIYEGKGGVKITSLIRKAFFALRFSELKIFLSNDITKESRILYHRNIQERALKALPFLKFDSDPYLVIDNGRLKWMYDAYTVTSRYPYSQPIDGKNYMRNSVKVVIDAYDGTINAYIAEVDDPLIQTLARIFPSIMKPLDEMPESLRAHVRYPEDIFAYQTTLYTVYHMERPQIFYNKEDQWMIPVLKGSASGESIGPIMRHLIMKLPGEEQAEFILMLPFTPRGKDNMSAWMVARSDGEHYGELINYRFPKQSLVFGPKQIVNRINQDADISRQISLWDQRGSEVVQGNLFVIPINESILYVRPLYLRAQGGKIPELKRVIVAYENQIAMEETLDLALARIFGGQASRLKGPKSKTDPGKKTVSPPSISSDLIRRAGDHFDRAESALRQGNWALYGEEMERLGEILRSLGR